MIFAGKKGYQRWAWGDVPIIIDTFFKAMVMENLMDHVESIPPRYVMCVKPEMSIMVFYILLIHQTQVSDLMYRPEYTF